MPDEKALRTPTFNEANSAPVTLGDGRTWHLPKPFLRLKPRFNGGKAAGYGPLTTDDTAWNDLRRAVSDAPESEVLAAIASLGAYMLSRNYAISDDDLIELFAWDLNQQWPTEVIGIANGRGAPKAASDGAT